MKHANGVLSLLVAATTAFGAGNGLTGHYFNNNGLVGNPVLTRTDATVNFDWARGGPGSGVGTDRFSARWTGQLEAPASGSFKFATVSNNGVRLWLNNNLILHHWTAHSTAKDESAPVPLIAGQKYDIKLEFYENGGNAVAKLLWTPPGKSEAAIPQASLFSAAIPAGSSPAWLYLSDLKPTVSQNGWGPYERDRSNGELGEHDGHPITIGGVGFARGLGAHAKSDLRYTLGGKYQTFAAWVGVDDEVGNRGSVIFQVWADGTKLFESPVMRGADGGKPVDVSVKDKNELRLLVLDAGDGIGYDHADWADAHLTFTGGDSPGGSGGGGGGGGSGPTAPPPPTGLTATPGNAQVVLAWSAVTGASSYNIYRGTSANGENATPMAMGITGTGFTNAGLTNGTKYFFKVAAVNAAGTGDKSNEASAMPMSTTPAPPPAPAAPVGLTAAPGNTQVVLSWNTVAGATSYNVYRGTAANAESNTAIATGIAGVTFTNTGLANGTTFFYKVAAVNANGTSAKSNEASAMPTAPSQTLSAAQKDAFRFLRQTTWGPNQGLVDHVVQVGKAAFLNEQIALPPSAYPDALISMPNMELVSEQFFQNAMQGPDQLRQRVAWALSQIFVVSGVKVDNTHAMVPYIRMLEQRAFDNVKDIMHDVSLSPAMGEFLDMVNNKKADTIKGTLPNENYAREWLQLFSIGLQQLNDNGTPQMGTNGQPVPTYDQSTVADMARVLTGWTYGDANATNPTNLNPPFYEGPMKPVNTFHDTGQKTVLGQVFPASQTAQQDFDQAVNLVFNHHNVGPFLVRELIQRLVTSNPSSSYIGDVVAVFNNNGQGVRGDLKAVVKAILLHPEAVNGTPTSGKFSEPALFELTLARALNASIADHPVLSDPSQDMAQRIWFAPSVFNYFSPNFRAGALFAPEMQIWTTATAMTRTNFVASLISGGFGSEVTIDYTPFNNVAADPNALLDTVDARIMGGTMSSQMRGAMATALATVTGTEERVRTALYLAAVSMQYQVEH